MSTLFIVEGDSAAGSLTATRDVQTQAVIHHARRPRASPLWQVVRHAWDDLLAGYEKHHRHTMGPLRPEAVATVRAFLRCGDLAAGFTRFYQAGDWRPETGARRKTQRGKSLAGEDVSPPPASRLKSPASSLQPPACVPAIHEWIPDDDTEQEFDLFDQRADSGKPVEIPREDSTILVLDGD